MPPVSPVPSPLASATHLGTCAAEWAPWLTCSSRTSLRCPCRGRTAPSSPPAYTVRLPLTTVAHHCARCRAAEWNIALVAVLNRAVRALPRCMTWKLLRHRLCAAPNVRGAARLCLWPCGLHRRRGAGGHGGSAGPDPDFQGGRPAVSENVCRSHGVWFAAQRSSAACSTCSRLYEPLWLMRAWEVLRCEAGA